MRKLRHKQVDQVTKGENKMKAKTRIKKRSRDAKGRFTIMSWKDRLVALTILLGTMGWGYQLHINRSVPSECGTPIIEVREVSASESTPDLYVPPSTVLKQMNLRPGLMSRIKNVFGEGWTYAAELIWRESSFNEFAINPTSGACGLAQALPCGKMECNLEDIDCQLEWIKNYTDERYGGAENALLFHTKVGWY